MFNMFKCKKDVPPEVEVKEDISIIVNKYVERFYSSNGENYKLTEDDERLLKKRTTLWNLGLPTGCHEFNEVLEKNVT